MKNLVALVAAAGLSAGFSAVGNAQSAPVASDPLLHTQTSFDFEVQLPYGEAAPLFGPEGERAWAGKPWDPKFIYPQPATDSEGAVFTVRHGAYDAVWVNTLFDAASKHYQYVYFLPGLMVTMIDVRFKPAGADSTAVNVVYARTAIAPEGNEHVKAMTEGDKAAGKDWQQAIDAYLAKTRTPAHP